MAKNKFNLAELVAEGKVSGLDTSTDFEVKKIPLEKIKSNEANFYELSNLQPLADSIALDGLQQPLVVMPADADGNYKLLSGHRRRAAIDLLVKDADEPISLSMVPCVIRDYKNDAMAELQLILANSTARVLTSAEISKQAERVEMLFYKLKEQGYEFPGRMRDQVAAACNVSATKLARLKVIRDKLIPEAMKLFEADKLSESAAYSLAQASVEAQHQIFDSFGQRTDVVEWKVNRRLGYLNKIDNIACENGAACTNKSRMFAEACKDKHLYDWLSCSSNGTCCKGCGKLLTCPAACPSFDAEIKKQKNKLKDEKLSEKNKEETEKLNLIASLSKYWLREGLARERAGVSSESVNELLLSMGCYAWPRPEDLKHYEMGDCDDGYYCKNYVQYLSANVYSALADLYGCSVDYLLCRTDFPTPAAATEADSKPAWIPGKETPWRNMPAVARFVLIDDPLKLITRVGYYDGRSWRHDRWGALIDLPCHSWYPIPEGGDTNGC